MRDSPLFTRRRLVAGLALGAVAFRTNWAFAAELIGTPRQTEGPFYPDKLPLDTDNDLLIINDNAAPAAGAVTHLGGKILDARGRPIKNAVVEIWQVDSNGVYLHGGSDNRAKRDSSFQGYGRFLTGSSGEYYFRTIKPVPYPGRAPHIHFAVTVKGHDAFTTQCYVRGEPLNERDGVLNSIRDPKARESVIVAFTPNNATANELSARFDIVLGIAPAG